MAMTQWLSKPTRHRNRPCGCHARQPEKLRLAHNLRVGSTEREAGFETCDLPTLPTRAAITLLPVVQPI